LEEQNRQQKNVSRVYSYMPWEFAILKIAAKNVQYYSSHSDHYTDLALEFRVLHGDTVSI